MMLNKIMMDDNGDDDDDGGNVTVSIYWTLTV